mmetsp:Transcript_18252/g.43926  ORF Transcript_18252/g.43926 Transcript_18252/m.43926 type:complete len:984 (+) Transcript_18252:400-3351(+)
MSPFLLLGLGVVERLPVAEAYESLAGGVLSKAAVAAQAEGSNDMSDGGEGAKGKDNNNDEARYKYGVDRDDGRGKHPKVLALGAVHLIGRRIRCLSVMMMATNITENGNGNMNDDDDDDRPRGIDQGTTGSATRCSSSSAPTEMEELDVLLSKIFPVLGDIAIGGHHHHPGESQRRTVLASAAFDACLELLGTAASGVLLLRARRQQLSDGTMRTWRDVALPLLERMLAARLRWIVSGSSCSDQRQRSAQPNDDDDNGGKTTTVSRASDRDEKTMGRQRLRRSSRAQLARAVVSDWMDVAEKSRRAYFDKFVGGGCVDAGADDYEGWKLFQNLSGMTVARDARGGGDDDDGDCGRPVEGAATAEKRILFGVGGIAQSLCKNRACALSSFFEGSSPPAIIGARDLVSLLREAAASTDVIRLDRKAGRCSEERTKETRQRASVRAFASWLSGSGGAVRALTKRGDDDYLLDDAMSSLVIMLRSESSRSVDMSIAALSMLWSKSPDWAPKNEPDGDEAGDRPGGNFFSNLLDALRMHDAAGDGEGRPKKRRPTTKASSSTMDPTFRALCSIVARVASRRPAILLPRVLEMRGCRAELTVEVVLNMLEQRPPPASGGHGHRPPKRCGDSERNGSGISEKDAEDAYFHQAVTGMLLENIESVPYLRSRLRADPSLFSDVPCETVVPQILEYLAARYCGKGKSGPSAGSTSLSGLLCKMMKSSTDAGRSDDFIGCIVASLHDIDNRKGSSEKMPSFVEHNKTAMTLAFSRKNGPLWRLELLGESPSSSSSDAAYGEILVAVAKSMVDMPSSSTPLALLSSLVDGQFCSWHAPPGDDAAASDRYEKRIVLATSGILRYAVREISLSRRNDIVDGETIFGRLAPLLVLRCIPRSYYAALHKALPSDKDVHSVMADLSAFLSKTLKAHATKRDESNLAKEEKKLLAELAGHTLPFSSRKLNVPCRYPAALSANESPVSLLSRMFVWSLFRAR